MRLTVSCEHSRLCAGLSLFTVVDDFDDHEMIDDWNTSAAWRREITAQPWWRDRISGGLVSYWVTSTWAT